MCSGTSSYEIRKQGKPKIRGHWNLLIFLCAQIYVEASIAMYVKQIFLRGELDTHHSGIVYFND